MATEDSYGQGVDIAALTDAPNAFALAFALADELVPRSVMRFASATARNATLTSPVAGMTAYLTTEQALTVYTGSAWVTLATNPGAWSTYTPTWTGATTNPSLGNGSLTGVYSLTGKTCHAHIDLTTGTTTAFGSGIWSFALPFTSASGHGTRVGSAHALGTVSPSRHGGQNLVSPGATTTTPFFAADWNSSPLAGADASTPFAWGTSYQMRISFTYEIA